MEVRRLVVGLGHPDRGDDAVGALVADEVAGRRSDLLVRHLLDPLALLDVLPDADALVVIDAALSTTPLGTVEVFEVAGHSLPALAGSPRSTHGVSLTTVLDLARTTATLPPSAWVVTVAAHGFDVGSPPHPAARAAVAEAATRVVDLLSQAGSG
ncbi:MAG: hydrogenase maturation protease [Jiangellales bacterium]